MGSRGVQAHFWRMVQLSEHLLQKQIMEMEGEIHMIIT